MARSKKSNGAGKLSITQMRDLINKKAGQNVAHDLKEENPTEVKDWIPTGSRWLDSIICRGHLAGIPVGKVVEIAEIGDFLAGKFHAAAGEEHEIQDSPADGSLPATRFTHQPQCATARHCKADTIHRFHPVFRSAEKPTPLREMHLQL